MTIFERLIQVIHLAYDFLSNDPTIAFIAGLFGGAVRWITLRENTRDGLASLAVGCLCAYYTAPVVYENFYSDQSKSVFALIAFVIGVGGISIANIIINIWKSKTVFQAAADAVIFLLTKGRGQK